MKLKHKVSSLVSLKSTTVSERYEAEVMASVRKAERAWRNAHRQEERLHRKQQRQPTPANTAALKRITAEAERLWLEFEELDRLMRSAPVTGLNRTGKGSVRRVGPAGSGDSRGNN